MNKAGLSPEDRDLGLDTPISRRDFLNGCLLAAGTPLVPACGSGERSIPPGIAWDGYGGTGDYASSHGNMYAAVDIAHRMRDGLLGGPDSSRRAIDTGERYDLVVVGGGISGLAAASFFQTLRGGRCLVLDNHPVMGGEAKRNEFMVDGVRLVGPQGSNQFRTIPPSGWLGDFWNELGIPGREAFRYQPWAPGVKPLEIPRENYEVHVWGDSFPSHGFFLPEADASLRLVRDAFGAGLGDTPWSERLRRDFMRWRANPQIYDGPDYASWLDGMTYEQLIVDVLGCDRAVARYADPIIAAATGGLGSDVISAQCAAQLGLPGTGNGKTRSYRLTDASVASSSFPGGNDGIMRHILKKIVPGSIEGDGFDGIMEGRLRFDELDRKVSPTRIRLDATVVRVEALARGGIEVVYWKGGDLCKLQSSRVVMANGAWSSRYVLADLTAAQRAAFDDFVRAPVLVVNVALRNWRFMYDLGLTAATYRDQFGFCCNVRQSMLVGDYQPALHPDKPIVLTFYVPFPRPGLPLRVQAAAARADLLGVSALDIERKVRTQMVRLFGNAGFDARRDIAGIILNRWGHAFVCPAPGFYSGRDGRPPASQVLRQNVGRIAFANADLNGFQNWRHAVIEGRYAVERLLD